MGCTSSSKKQNEDKCNKEKFSRDSICPKMPTE